MAQTTKNIAKSTTPPTASAKKKRRRRKKRVATIIALILILIVLCLAGLLVYTVLFKPSIGRNGASHIETEEIYHDVLENTKPLELPVPEADISLTISVVGDCTLGTDENFNYSRSLNAYYEQKGPEYFLKNVKSIFESDDLTIANLEGTFTDLKTRADKTYAFKGPAEFVNILTKGSVEAVTIPFTIPKTPWP